MVVLQVHLSNAKVSKERESGNTFTKYLSNEAVEKSCLEVFLLRKGVEVAECH